MIAENFEYHRAISIEEAVALFEKLQEEGKCPLFYNGGTEIITLRRIRTHYTRARAVIDLKGIPECLYTGFRGDDLVIGASIPLAQLEEMDEFPLLSKNCSRIADHTSREKITIGGNVCGNIKYKEAVLPLLLADASAVVASNTGITEKPLKELFNQHILLEKDDFIVQFIIKKKYLNRPYISKKMTKIDRIGYPLLTVSALQTEEKAHFAFSGLCEYPFRSSYVEEVLNDNSLSVTNRVTQAIEQLPAPILNDMDGSSAYRSFVLRNVLEEAIDELKEGREA